MNLCFKKNLIHMLTVDKTFHTQNAHIIIYFKIQTKYNKIYKNSDFFVMSHIFLIWLYILRCNLKIKKCTNMKHLTHHTMSRICRYKLLHLTLHFLLLFYFFIFCTLVRNSDFFCLYKRY